MKDSSENGRLTVDRLSTFEQFAALQPEWQALENKCAKTIFIKYFWLCQWWQTYGADLDLWTLTVRDAGELVGILPLMLVRSAAGVRRLTLMGTGEITPNHLNIIAEPEKYIPVAEALTAYLGKTLAWDVLEFDKLVAESPLIDMLGNHLRTKGLIVQSKVSAECSCIRLPETYELYLKTRSHNMRRRIHKARQHLVRDYPTAAFKRVETPEELEKAMAALIRLHQIRWQKRGYPGSFSNDDFIGFHKAVALSALQQGHLRSCYLEVDDEIIAVKYAFVIADTVQGYLSSFDDRWADYSLGTVLTSYQIESSIESGLQLYDFLEGGESYKSEWAVESQDNVLLQAFTPNLRGRLTYFTTVFAGKFVNWAVESVPVQIRRPLWQALLRWKQRQR